MKRKRLRGSLLGEHILGSGRGGPPNFPIGDHTPGMKIIVLESGYRTAITSE